MKFNCDRLRDGRRARRRRKVTASMRWHTKFALLPVKVSDGDCRWLERVERRRVLFESLEKYLNELVIDRLIVGQLLSGWEYRSVNR